MKISKIFLTLGLAAILVAPIVQAQSFDFLTEEQRALVVSGFQKEYIQRGLAIAVSQPGITPRVAGAVSLNTSLTTGLISGLANLLNQKTTPTVPTGAYTTPPSTQPGGTLTTGGLSGSNVNSNPCNYNKVCEQVRGESTNNCPTDCLLNQGGSMLTSQNANIGSGSQTSGVTNSGLPSFRFGCTTSGQCQLDQQGFYPEWYPDLMSCKAK